MTRQTAEILDALGEPEAIELLVLLLELEEATQTVLIEKIGRAQPTVSRYMRKLERAGLVVRDRTAGPYRVADPERTRRLLDDAADLGHAVATARAADERALQRRVRRTRLRAAAEKSRDKGD